MDATARWRAQDGAHHIHPFTDPRALARAGGSRMMVRGEGVWIEDSEGKRYLDAMAGLWCVALGYGRRELAGAAARQMETLPYYNTFFGTATPPAVELAERLVALTPAGLHHVFFANSGSEANDTIVRLVRYYWQLEGRPERRVILSRELAYHGSTLMAAAAGGMAAMHAQAGTLPDFAHARAPYFYRDGAGMTPEAFGRLAAGDIEQKILEIGPERVAAFIGEPIQGAGGVIVPPPGYWSEVREICRKHDVLFVADEVITGFGRTGEWFGSTTYDLEPDMMTLAKALTSGYVPLSAVMVGDRVAERLAASGGKLMHGFTYSGHPAAAAVALENLRLLEDEGHVDRVREETGPHLQRRLREVFADHPLVGEVRGTGLIAAVELVADKAARRLFDPPGEVGLRCLDHCFDLGVIPRSVRDGMCLSPPLVITAPEIDEMIARLREAVDRTARDLGRA